MIKFFRHIRYNLMSENKTGKYFKYAIGEIILVVIGILIALQINNWNESKNNEQKINKILKQIQKDLLNDIKEAEFISEWYANLDKELTIFFSKTLNKENLEKNSYNFSLIGRQSVSFSQSSQSFNRLNSQLEIIPEKYNDLLNKLNRLYVERADFLKRDQSSLNKLIENYKKELYESYKWIEDFSRTIHPKEADNYFYNSKKHRAYLRIFNLNVNSFHNQVSVIKNQSLICYLLIKDFLNDTSELPEVIKNYGLDYTYNTTEDFIGGYGRDSIVTNFIKKKYNILFWISSTAEDVYSEGLILREYGKDSLGFVFSNNFPMKFYRNTNNKIKGFKGSNSNNPDMKVDIKKIDND